MAALGNISFPPHNAVHKATSAGDIMLQPLQYAPWTSDIELAFYTSLASLKMNHDKLDSSARKCLGLYEIQPKDTPNRSTRMQIHGTALTTDETPKGYCRAEGQIRNFNTIDEFRAVDRNALLEEKARMIWDAIKDGTIYSCPSLLCYFTAICFADLKKYKFAYHFAFPAIHSDPSWKVVSSASDPESGGFRRLEPKETTHLVEAVQTWRYTVDTRQHGFFLAKRLRRDVLEAEWRKGKGMGEIEEEEEDGNLSKKPTRRKSRTSSLTEMGFLWYIGSLSSYDSGEKGFFHNAQPEDRFVCFADPSTFPQNPGWMLRNLLVLVRQKWQLDDVQILCYRDTHDRRDQPTSLIMSLQSAEPIYGSSFDAQQAQGQATAMSSSTAWRPDQVDQFGELIITKPDEGKGEESARPKTPPQKHRAFTKAFGWERGDTGKVTARSVDLAAYMDPTKLADQAVELNLKLIKWRIAPSIDLDAIKHTSCLLLGAGTLGSYIARNLLGWGVKKITFVDNGRVSYSNPVRQPLYDFKDCTNGGVWKAQRAADALMEIYPGVDSQGVVMNVAMAGHPITGDELKARKQFEQLQKLVDAHDAIFLLMDTREARWLPTVMGKSAGKIVINAALGFDTYVVMRHGQRTSPALKPKAAESSECTIVEHAEDVQDPLAVAASDPVVNGDGKKGEPEELGCYFCSDVVAPADSLKNATLDQQCTVTRPGAALTASALAVELLVSITQHKLKSRAPAPPPLVGNGIAPAPSADPTQPNSHPLGTVPHQLRGYMPTWQTLQVSSKAYDRCAACSPKVLEAYEEEGWNFVRQALNDKNYIEELSGLAEVHRQAEAADMAMEAEDDWSEDDDKDGELL